MTVRHKKSLETRQVCSRFLITAAFFLQWFADENIPNELINLKINKNINMYI